jgi:hypothetical protein
VDRDRAHDIIIAIINTIILIILINIWIHIFVGFVQPSAQAAPLHHSLQVLAVWLCGHFFPPMALLKKSFDGNCICTICMEIAQHQGCTQQSAASEASGDPKVDRSQVSASSSDQFHSCIDARRPEAWVLLPWVP